MGDPVSWLVVEPGWDVVDAEGKRVGQVKETLGDENEDIFNGVAVSPGLLKTARYVPAEVVDRIENGLVRLRISHAEFESLGEYDETPTA